MTKANSKKPSPPAVVDKSRVLQVEVAPEVSHERAVADVVTSGVAANAGTAIEFAKNTYGEVSLTDMIRSLRDQGKAINGGDLQSAERMLMAQAVTLNAVFTELARRSAVNMGQYMDATERYMRLALKAQGQCRATLETLAAIKNPPVVFARQANIANGPQQVNNGVIGAPKRPEPLHAHTEAGNQQTKLLEGAQHGGTVLDAGAAAKAAGSHRALETVGAINRAAKRRGQGAS